LRNKLPGKAWDRLRARLQECRERLLRAGSWACAPNKPFECTRPIAARIERYGFNGALSCGSYPWALGCRIGWARKIRRCRSRSPCIAQWRGSHNLCRRRHFLPNSPRTMDRDRKAERSRVRLTVLPAVQRQTRQES